MKTLDPKHTDWRKEADDRDPDDELLPQTPADVVAVLGFDPLELEEPAANSIFDDRLEAEDRVRRQCEDIFRSAFDSALDSAERELEKNRRREPDWQDWDGIYWDSLFAGLPDALAGAGQLAFKHAATAFNTRLSDPDAGFAAKGFADARRTKLAGVPERVKEAVRSSVSRGLAGGESAQAVSRRVAEAFDGAKEIEGKLVAETEAQVTYGTAMDAALKAAGFAKKRWVTVGDERVRESHVACGQQGPVAIGRAFSNGLMFPGDPDGPASEVIACRCHLEGVL